MEQTQEEKRYFKKDNIPEIIRVKSRPIIFNHNSPIQEKIPQVTVLAGKIRRNPMKMKIDDYALPFSGLNTGGTRDPRSIVHKVGEKRYVWVKGCNNPLHPDLPFTYIGIESKSGYGYRLLYAQTLEEVVRTNRHYRILTQNDNLVHPSYVLPLIATSEILEVPVPTGNGGFEVRPVVEAFTQPWEVHDELRALYVERMRKNLLNSELIKPSTKSAKVIVKNFFKYYGFFQTETISPAPFRNYIDQLIANPILFDLIYHNQGTSIKTQISNIQELYLCFLDTIGIEAEVQFPSLDESTDLIVNINTITFDDDSTPDDLKAKPFSYYKRNGMTSNSIEIIRSKLHIDPDEEIRQLDGMGYIHRVFNNLPSTAQEQIKDWISNEIQHLAQNIVNASCIGLNLSQCTDAKDTFGGYITDQGDAGGYDVEMDDITERMDLLCQNFKAVDDHAIVAFRDLIGATGIVDEEFFQSIKVTFEKSIIEGMKAQKYIFIPEDTRPEYAENYLQTLKSWYENYSQYYSEQNDQKNFSDITPDEQYRFLRENNFPISLAAILCYVKVSEDTKEWLEKELKGDGVI